MATQRRAPRNAPPKKRPTRKKAPRPAPPSQAPGLRAPNRLGKTEELAILYTHLSVVRLYHQVGEELRKLVTRQLEIIQEVLEQWERPGEVTEMMVKQHLRKFLQATIDAVEAADAHFRTSYDETAPRKESQVRAKRNPTAKNRSQLDQRAQEILRELKK
jgi:hypothetical protein